MDRSKKGRPSIPFDRDEVYRLRLSGLGWDRISDYLSRTGPRISRNTLCRGMVDYLPPKPREPEVAKPLEPPIAEPPKPEAAEPVEPKPQESAVPEPVAPDATWNGELQVIRHLKLTIGEPWFSQRFPKENARLEAFESRRLAAKKAAESQESLKSDNPNVCQNPLHHPSCSCDQCIAFRTSGWMLVALEPNEYHWERNPDWKPAPPLKPPEPEPTEPPITIPAGHQYCECHRAARRELVELDWVWSLEFGKWFHSRQE